MTDRAAVCSRAVRRLSRLGLLFALICAATAASASATASPLPRPWLAPKGPLPIPGAFRLPASNGYTLYAIAVPARSGHPATLLLFVSAKGKGVSYFAPAKVTETSIQADLGDLGEISVAFQRSNQAAKARCGKKTIRFDSGHYEGTIEFHGEEGYTNVEATAVPGNIDYFLSGFCGEGFITGGPGRRPQGAELYVRNPGLGPELSVRKSRPEAAAEITAWTSEYSNGISIERFAGLRMPAADFSYDRHLRTATVSPPGPFSGSARFDLGKKAGQRWSGDLAVDLPGRAGVPLTAPALRATLHPSE